MSWNTYRNSFGVFFAHVSADKFTSFCVQFFSSKDIFNQTILKCVKGKCFETNIWSFASFFSLKFMFYFKKSDFYWFDRLAEI